MQEGPQDDGIDVWEDDGGWRPSPKFAKKVNTTFDMCDLDRRIGLTSEEFMNEYFKLGRPVVIGGQLDDWVQRETWRKEDIKEALGHKLVKVSTIPHGQVYGKRPKTMSLADYVDLDQRKVREPLYIAEPLALSELGQISSEYKIPPVLEPIERTQGNMHSGAQFFLGGRGSGAPMHYHNPAWNGLVFGYKRWSMLPPSKAVFSTDHPANWFEFNHSTSKAFECVQRPGETILLPAMWSHATQNLGDAVCVGVEFSASEFGSSQSQEMNIDGKYRS